MTEEEHAQAYLQSDTHAPLAVALFLDLFRAAVAEAEERRLVVHTQFDT